MIFEANRGTSSGGADKHLIVFLSLESLPILMYNDKKDLLSPKGVAVSYGASVR